MKLSGLSAPRSSDVKTSDNPAQDAQFVRWMMPVDLVAAAELAGVGRAPVWALVSAELGASLRRWHARDGSPNQTCAMAADFADLLWPMLEGADEQEAFHLLRVWEPPCVLPVTVRSQSRVADPIFPAHSAADPSLARALMLIR